MSKVKRGRPSKSESEALSKKVSVYFTPRQHADLCRCAAGQGVAPASLIRSVIVRVLLNDPFATSPTGGAE